jgi:hypothetical protein
MDQRSEEARLGPPWRELGAIVLLVVLGDVTIYRGHGLAGPALLFLTAPWLLLLGSPRLRGPMSLWVILGMLTLLAARTLWCGSGTGLAVGLALVFAFAMSLSGQRPYVLETALFASQTLWAGYRGLLYYGRRLSRCSLPIRTRGWLSIVLPVLVSVVFSLLFVLANPDLLEFLGEHVSRLLDAVREWLLRFSPSFWEVLFWLATAWIVVGLLRPVVDAVVLTGDASGTPDVPGGVSLTEPAALYAACRNTLVAVSVLFAVYLVFEFKTLWFRVFPPGFHYSGYAHEGAAWLTVALALATVILSLVFSGAMLRDPRLPRLRRLAWLWSLENLLLAVAVYHRLFIYVGFNGMTRMRIVGLFGMSAVVAGFLLVVWKIARNRDFVWLLRHHLWALAIAVYLFAITPVDALWVHYNVRRILAGDPAPSVQISVHPITAEGRLLLQPLLDCDNVTIREGVRALLAQTDDETERLAQERETQGWTAYQWADCLLLEQVRRDRSRWTQYADPRQRDVVLRRFHQYAYQWY